MASVNGKKRKLNSAAEVPPEKVARTEQGTAKTAKNDATKLEDQDEDHWDEEPEAIEKWTKAKPDSGLDNLHLESVEMENLDFDFEKQCSVTHRLNDVFCCLICGAFVHSRQPDGIGWNHALEEDHHVFINLKSKRIYLIPEGWEVKHSFARIRFNVEPYLSKEEVLELDTVKKGGRTVTNKYFVPGFVGLHNTGQHDYLNAVLQALSHVPPLRNYFILADFETKPWLIRQFSIIVRRIWNPLNFRDHVAPHDMVQAVMARSNSKYSMDTQADPAIFMNWFLNNLHQALGGSATKKNSSIIQKCFEGRMHVESQAITTVEEGPARLIFEDVETRIEDKPYKMLPLDLPPPRLFQETLEGDIPQMTLARVLRKFDGTTAVEHNERRARHRLLHPLPPYLIMNFKRYTQNKYRHERNPVIITFPTEGIDMAPYVDADPKYYDPGKPIYYDLCANIYLESISSESGVDREEDKKKIWHVQIHDRSRDQWYEVTDLDVQKVEGTFLFARESYLQIWERRTHPKTHKEPFTGTEGIDIRREGEGAAAHS